MKIQLNNQEILTAIHQYVGTLGIDLTEKTIGIEFTQGRKNKLTADITINESSDVIDDEPETTDALIADVVEPVKEDPAPESVDGSASIFG